MLLVRVAVVSADGIADALEHLDGGLRRGQRTCAPRTAAVHPALALGLLVDALKLPCDARHLRAGRRLVPLGVEPAPGGQVAGQRCCPLQAGRLSVPSIVRSAGRRQDQLAAVIEFGKRAVVLRLGEPEPCLLYTSDAADE